jgi:hypothetical protein
MPNPRAESIAGTGSNVPSHRLPTQYNCWQNRHRSKTLLQRNQECNGSALLLYPRPVSRTSHVNCWHCFQEGLLLCGGQLSTAKYG